MNVEYLDRYVRRYYRYSWVYAMLFWLTRITAGLGGSLVPFLLGNHQSAAVVVSLGVALATALDSIVRPRDFWRLYSQACDMLKVERLKALGQYESQSAALEIVMATEASKFNHLPGFDEVLKAMREAREQARHALAPVS